MYEKIEKLLKDKGISAYRMCKDTGLSRSLVSQWKNGSFNPKHDKLELLADYFDVPIAYFYEADPIFNVSAGTGTLNEDYDDAPKQAKDSSLVRVVGESMLPSLHDGDIVRVNHSFEISDIRDSDFVCVKINGFEDCIKHVEIKQDGVWLRGENPDAYTDTFYSMQDVLTLPVTIIGIAEEIVSRKL